MKQKQNTVNVTSDAKTFLTVCHFETDSSPNEMGCRANG